MGPPERTLSSMTRAFDADTAIYDLLAGGGKNTQFKERLATSRRELTVLQLVRSKRLKPLYRLRDRWS